MLHPPFEQDRYVEEVIEVAAARLVAWGEFRDSHVHRITEIPEPCFLNRAQRPLLRFLPLLD